MKDSKKLKTDDGSLVFVNLYGGTFKTPFAIFGPDSFYLNDNVSYTANSINNEIIVSTIVVNKLKKIIDTVDHAEKLLRHEAIDYCSDLNTQGVVLKEVTPSKLEESLNESQKAELIERVLERESQKGENLCPPKELGAYRIWKHIKLDSAKDEDERRKLRIYFTVFEDNKGNPLPR